MGLANSHGQTTPLAMDATPYAYGTPLSLLYRPPLADD